MHPDSLLRDDLRRRRRLSSSIKQQLVVVVRNHVVVVVHHDRQRLTQDDRGPDDGVAEPGAVVPLHKLGHERERNLRHHAHKGPDLEGLERDRHEVLVEEGTEEEDRNGGRLLRAAKVDHRKVEVADAPVVHGHVPVAPEDVDVVGVPPVVVELAVGKVQHFAHQVQERVEGQVEEAQPHQVVWDGQLEEAFARLGQVHVGERDQRVAHGRNHPLLEQTHYDVPSDDDLEETFDEEALSDAGSTREVEFVAERWSQQEVEQILQVQVVRVEDQIGDGFVFGV